MPRISLPVLLSLLAAVGCDWAAADGPWNDPPEPTPEVVLLTAVGEVTTPDGARPVAGAVVRLQDDAGTVAEVGTGSTGRFEVEALPPGAYSVDVVAGHFGMTTVVELSEGPAVFDLGALRLSSTRPVVLDVRDAAAGSFDPVDERLGAMGLASVRVGPSTSAGAADLFATPQGLFEYGLVLIGGDLGWSSLTEDEQAMDGLRDYLEAGGGLYLSGEAWPVLEALVPGAVVVAEAVAGYGYVRADVDDVALLEGLAWDGVGVPMVEGTPLFQAAGPGVEVLLSGEVDAVDGGPVAGPLAVRTTFGAGRIAYVTFRAAEPRADEWWQGSPAPWSLPDGSWDGRGAAIDRVLLGL